MKKGDKVEVFYDPLTEEEFEGVATLLVFQHTGGQYEGRKISTWIVKFDDGAKVQRKILEPASG